MLECQNCVGHIPLVLLHIFSCLLYIALELRREALLSIPFPNHPIFCTHAEKLGHELLGLPVCWLVVSASEWMPLCVSLVSVNDIMMYTNTASPSLCLVTTTIHVCVQCGTFYPVMVFLYLIVGSVLFARVVNMLRCTLATIRWLR